MPDRIDAVVAQIEWAKAVVARAEVDQELRVAAFEHALRVAAGSAWRLPVVSGPALAGAAAMPPVARIAEELALHEDAVDQVYEEDDHGSVRLCLSRSRLPASRAAAMRNVALTLAVGRQIVRPEEETPFSRLRDECDELGVLDRPNFATELKRLDPELRMNGGRNTRTAQVRRRHHEMVRQLIESLLATGTLACAW